MKFRVFNKNYVSQKGSTSVALLLVFVVVLAIASVTFQRSMRVSHSNENVKVKQTEKWQARSAMNVLQQVLRLKLPEIYNDDLSAARALGEGRRLPAFDAEDVRESKPLVVINTIRGGTIERSEFPVDECTSYFGKVNTWANARSYAVMRDVEERGYSSQTLSIVSLEEVSRQFSGGVEPAYMLGYILDSKSGYYRTRANGEILLGPNDVNCGTTVRLEAIPTQIVRGESVILRATFTNATKLIFTNSAGDVIHETFVDDQPTPQTYDYTFAPDRTDSYRVEAQSNASCFSRTPLIEVGVSEPPQNVCLTNPPQIALFQASSTEVNAGETVNLSWETAGSVSRVTLNGVQVSPTVTRHRVTINVTTTFTLRVEDNDPDRDCPIERTITITVRVAPACGFATPTIQNFSANPTSITPGESSSLSWNITALDAGAGTTRITGPNGFQQVGLSASGNLTVSPPVAEGDYTYTIITENVCPDGTRLTAQASVIIRVRSCPSPVIDGFSVNPMSVTQGGNQMLLFSWNISGNPSAVSISNGVGGGLPASGNVEILQPQTTTTYTLTAVGCGQTRQAQVTVTVVVCPVPVINSFTANPLVVTAGGSQTVRLAWDASGTIDSMNISGIGNVTGNFIDIPQPQTTTDYVLTASGCGTPVSRVVRVEVNSAPGESCNFNMPSENICSVTNTNQCGPHRIEGQLTVSGNNFTFVQSHSPFGAFGQGYLQNVSFYLLDGANTGGNIISRGSFSYTDSGAVYWNQQPSGAGTLYQNGVTISGTLPPNTPMPLRVEFTVGYGASAGNDVKYFTTRGSPGGCGGGSTSCNVTYDNFYWCDEHTNATFNAQTAVYFIREGNTVTVTVPFDWNRTTDGGFEVYGSAGQVERVFWTTVPNNVRPGVILISSATPWVERTYTNPGQNLEVNGTMGYALDPLGGACTIAGSQHITITVYGREDACSNPIARAAPKSPFYADYTPLSTFLTTIMPIRNSCS